MTRATLLAFFLLTGFFYVTGKPVDATDPMVNTFASLSKAITDSELAVKNAGSAHLVLPTKFQPGLMTDPELAISAQRSGSAPPNSKTNAPALEVPVRNPRRLATNIPQTVDVARKDIGVPDAFIRTSADKQESSAIIIGEARNQYTDAAVKPLATRFQQRHDNIEKPILGPRLTTVLIKRELRRVGCYDGSVTSSWGKRVRVAIRQFNASAGTSLEANAPKVSSLESLQQVTKVTCHKKPAIGRTIIATAPQVPTATSAQKKNNKWRTKVELSKTGYRSFATSRKKRLSPPSIKPRTAKARRIPSVKRKRRPRAIAKKTRARTARKIRVSKKRARRRTAVRSWKRTYRRKRFGFRSSGGGFSLNN